MKIPANRPHLSRRQFLIGAGGASLALPFLPSLIDPREARAQSMPVRKRYIHFCTQHGGVWGGNFFPAQTTLTDRVAYADRQIQRGALVPTVASGRATLSPILNAASSTLTPALAAKLNVIRGLDIPFQISHHGGGHLGNLAANTGQADDAISAQMWPRRTIDQVMAWSPSFYPSMTGVRQRNIVLGSGISWNYANPSARTGAIQTEVNWPELYSSNNLFTDVFGSSGGTMTAPRPLIIDRVIADFQRLRNGTPRLSAGDRQRLDQHVAGLTDLERQLQTTVSCGTPTRPTDSHTIGDAAYDHTPSEQIQSMDIYLNIIAQAFACGASCVAVNLATDTYSNFTGDWHQDVAHNCDETMGQATFDASMQTFFEGVFLDLARRLDAIDDGGGRTVLDNTLMVWTHEHGNRIHGSYSIPVVTAGGAGAFLRTGSYIDYRNPAILMDPAGPYVGDPAYAGLPWNQFLATQLLAMGVPASEWEEPGGGYGHNYVGRAATAGHWYPSSVLSSLSSVLPLLGA